MGNFRLLIFDLDGTLVDSQHDLAAAVNHVRSCYCLPSLDLATVRSYVGSGLTVLLQKALPGLSPDAIEAAKEKFRGYYLHHLLDTTMLYPGVIELIRQLPGQTKAILTNKPEEYTRKILEGLGIDRYFAVVWGGDTGNKRKPDPEPLQQIMRKLGFQPQETLMIGDGVNDVLSAKAAGVRCAVVSTGYTPKPELLRLKPDYVLDNLPALAVIVEA